MTSTRPFDRFRAPHPGLVVGVRTAGASEIWNRGVAPDAVFEIGSITKTFTATLLASLARDGVVGLDDPVAKHLPVAPPVLRSEITLEDLATHRSGLPRLPAGTLIDGYTRNRRDPYARFDEPRLRRAIAETKPKRAPKTKFAYSNYGYGLLGYALARAAGTTYAALVRERIAAPLQLERTAPDTRGLVQGHGFFGRPAAPWNLALLAGAGGLRSTAADMLAYLALHAPDATGPLAGAARDTRVKRATMGKLGVGLAWLILPGGREWLLHDGGTGGFRSFAAVEPASGNAVVVLGNRARSVTRLGMRIMNETPPR